MKSKKLAFKLWAVLLLGLVFRFPAEAASASVDSSDITDPLAATTQAAPEDSAANPAIDAYERRLDWRKNFWDKLCPQMITLQYAGDIGMISTGVGWAYGKSSQWETHLLFGFTPHRYEYSHYWTFTLRETFAPWKLRLSGKLAVRPLTVSLSLSSTLHGDFWMSEPDRYPSGYYGFSSRMRFHIGVGQRLNWFIPREKRFLSSSVSVYYEISSCDLYIRQKFLNSSIPLKDILVIGVGVILSI